MNNNEMISISKSEYEYLTKIENDNMVLENCDFMIKIYAGAVIPITHPNYNENRIDIEIYDIDNNSIKINGKEYSIKTQVLFNRIKEYLKENLEKLIEYSKKEDNDFLCNYALDGVGRTIKIKYGQLLINVNGAVSGEISDFSQEFISKITDIIINESNKNSEDYIMETIKNTPIQKTTPLDEEYNKYANLYEERFGKKAYIPEPSGTKEFAIECIKKCLQENRDILDELYYSNKEN